MKKDIDYFADKDVISVLGTCKKCRNYTFVNKKGLCRKCE